MKPTNRILLAFKDWEAKKAELYPFLNDGKADQRVLRKLELEHLRQANHRMQKTLRPDEQPFMALLQNQVKNLEKQLYPNNLQRMLMRWKDRFIDGPAYLQKQHEQRQANLESLSQQLQQRGLGTIAGKLEQHLEPERKQACLPLHCQLGADKRLHFDLYFDKDAYGNFQLHRIDGTLHQNGASSKHHQFELDGWPGLKADEALSLLEGRAVKQPFTDILGRNNERWTELSPQGVKYYGPEYAFDLPMAVTAMPNITRKPEELIPLLENGQLIATHWKHEGHYQNIFVQADPANRTLQLFDARQKPVSAEHLNRAAAQQKSKIHPEQAQSQRKAQKKAQAIH